MTIVDASVVIDLLAPRDEAHHQRLLQLLPADGDLWLAPDVLPFEVFAVMRRYVQRGELSGGDAERRLRRLPRLPIELLPTMSLLTTAWTLRENLGAADALYAAAAQEIDSPLMTTDARLARAAASAGIEAITP